MSNMTDSLIQSSKPSPSVDLDFLEGELKKRYTALALEAASLRKKNGELLERLLELEKHEFDRSRNQEIHQNNETEIKRLRETERSLRDENAQREKRSQELEKRLEEAGQEIAALQRELTDQRNAFSQLRDDLNRKLAKLTDESWAKDLEIEDLRALRSSEEAVTLSLKAECSLHLSQLQEAHDQQAKLESTIVDKEAEFRALSEDKARELREAQEAHAHEIRSLQDAKTDLESQLAQAISDHSERLSENETRLAGVRDDYEKRILDLEQLRTQEKDEFQRLQSEQGAKIQKLESDRAEQCEQLEKANRLLMDLEQALESSAIELQSTNDHATQTLQAINHQHAQQLEMHRNRESQMNAEIMRLRQEYATLEQRLRDSNEMASELHTALEAKEGQRVAELRNLERESERRLMEMQSKYQDDFQKQFEVVLAENKNLRQLLDVRDTKIEVDRNNLKQWQEKLNYLDQHLRQSKDSLKKDKAEVVRLAKQLANELQLVRNHPFKDYIELSEMELSKLHEQLSNTSSLSPVRRKLEERLSQLIEQHEYMKSVLGNSQQQLEERIHAVQSILRH